MNAVVLATVYGTDPTMLKLRWLAGAVLLLVVGLGLARRRRQDVRRQVWPRVQGLVVDEHWAGYGAGGDSSYEPVVAFRTQDGAEITGQPRGGVRLGLPIVGRQVPVWYDPVDPNRFEARIHALDRAGSVLFLAALLPAALFVIAFLP